MSAEQSTAGYPRVTFDNWRAGVESDLKGIPFDKKLVKKTYEGIPLQPLYTEEDVRNLPHRLSFPGFRPYVRGATTHSAAGTHWRIVQHIANTSATSANEAIKKEIEGGATGIFLSLSHRSGDSRPHMLIVENASDVETLCRGIDPSSVIWFAKLEGNFLSFLGVMDRFCATSGLPLSSLSMNFLADPFIPCLGHGNDIERLQAGLDDVTETIRWSEKTGSSFRTAGIDATAYHNLGATAVQELAFVLAEMSDLMHHVERNSVSPEKAARRMFVSFGVGPFFLMEIAKIRAARMLWGHLLDSFGVPYTPLYIHAVTGKYEFSALDPYTNTLRSTTEALSAVLSACDAVTVYPFDVIQNGGTEEGRRLARNTQLIIREESHVDAVMDPLGGSYCVETLTASIAERSWELFRLMEEQGGMSEALASGFVRRELDTTHSLRQTDAATRKRTIIGVNKYANIKEEVAGNAGTETEDERRLSVPYERLRLRGRRYEKMFGKMPTVFLAAFGSLKQYKPRVDFSRLYFHAGGFATIASTPLSDASDASEKFAKTGASVAVICSSDENYPALVPNVVNELRRINKSLPVILAGYPKEYIETFRGAGVTEFIYLGSDAVAILSRMYDILGV